MRLIEVYQCKAIPARRPGFVDSQPCTIQQDAILIAVNPDHEIIRDLRLRGKQLHTFLRRLGFKGAQFVWSGRINQDWIESRFWDVTSFNQKTGLVTGQADLTAYQEYWELPAEVALMEMFTKFGVLCSRPKQKQKRH